MTHEPNARSLIVLVIRDHDIVRSHLQQIALGLGLRLAIKVKRV